MKLLSIIATISVLLLSANVSASSDEAWKEFDSTIKKSCLSKINLQEPKLQNTKVTGQRIDFSDDVGYSALMVSGKSSYKGQSTTQKYLCLYNKKKGTAELGPMQ